MTSKFNFQFLITTVIAVASLYLAWIPASQEFFGKSLSIKKLTTFKVGPELVHPIKDVKLLVGESEVKTPLITIIHLENDGAKPVTPEDFASPIELNAQKDVKVISAAILEEDQALMSISVVDNKIRLSKSLLNPKDHVYLKILTSGESPTFTVNARIVGIKEVKMLEENSESPSKGSWVIKFINLISLVVLIFMSTSFALSSKKVTYNSFQLTALACGFCAIPITLPFPYITNYHAFETPFRTIVAAVIPMLMACLYVKLKESKEKAPNKAKNESSNS